MLGNLASLGWVGAAPRCKPSGLSPSLTLWWQVAVALAGQVEVAVVVAIYKQPHRSGLALPIPALWVLVAREQTPTSPRVPRADHQPLPPSPQRVAAVVAHTARTVAQVAQVAVAVPLKARRRREVPRHPAVKVAQAATDLLAPLEHEEPVAVAALVALGRQQPPALVAQVARVSLTAARLTPVAVVVLVRPRLVPVKAVAATVRRPRMLETTVRRIVVAVAVAALTRLAVAAAQAY